MMEASLENSLLHIFATVSDARSRVNAVNTLIKSNPSLSAATLTNPLVAEHLLDLLIKCRNKHPTVIDILHHVLDRLGSPVFTTNLGAAVSAHWPQYDARVRLHLLRMLTGCATGRTVLRAEKCRVAQEFVDGDLLRCLEEWRMSAASDPRETRAKTVGRAEFIVESLEVVESIVRMAQREECRELIISAEILSRLHIFITSLLPHTDLSQPSLIIALGRTAFCLAEHFHTTSDLQSASLDALNKNNIPWGSVGFLMAWIDTMSAEELTQNYQRVLFPFNNSLPNQTEAPLSIPVVISFVKRLKNLDMTPELSEMVGKLWSTVFRSPHQSKIVEIIRHLIPLWTNIPEAVRKNVFSNLCTLSWKSLYKLKCYVLLNLDRAAFSKQVRLRPVDLLEMIPDKYFKIPLSDLLVQIANAEDIADILVKTTDHNAFLMRDVLPGLARKEKNFIPDLLRMLKEKRCVVGYGPVFYAIRVAKIQVDAGMVLREYICGNVDLAVFADDTLRVEAFAFFCEHADPVRFFARFVHFISTNVDHQFSRFREPFLRSALQFLRRTATVLSQNKAKSPGNDHRYFAEKYDEFLSDLLIFDCSPTSSYARRSSALQLAKAILSSSYELALLTPGFTSTVRHSLLQQLFWESFPDNQLLIVGILSLLPSSPFPPGEFSRENLSQIADQQADSCGSNAARLSAHLDALLHAGRPAPEMVEELLGKLEKNVERAGEKGVQWTARYAPLYGQIARLRSAMERWTGGKVTGEWVERAVGACWTVSRLVNEVFADHTQDLSMDRSVLVEDDAAPTAQMLYVCCWRCIREVSLLLTELLTGRLVPSAAISRIQDVFLWNISQLFMTRHTGTFETLAEQIHKLSVLLVEKHGEAGKAVVVSSLDDIVEEVTGAWSSPLQPENTRRSAGVPRLWCILYSPLRRTEVGEESFNTSTDVLFSINGNTTSADDSTRVRSINILEAVFRENALNELSDAYIGRGFIVACDAMTSAVWSIRNAAACLFTGLMQRVFGPGVKKPAEELQFREACLPAEEFFGDYPEVFDYALEVLDAGTGVFPVLLILAKLYGSAEDSEYVQRLLEPLWKEVQAKEWRVREMAARAMVGLFGEVLWEKLLAFVEMMRSEDSGESAGDKENMRHGVLLVLKELLASGHLLEGKRTTSFTTLLAPMYRLDAGALPTRSLLLEVSREFVRKYRGRTDEFLEEYLDWLQALSRSETGHHPGISVYVEAYFDLPPRGVTVRFANEHTYFCNEVAEFIEKSCIVPSRSREYDLRAVLWNKSADKDGIVQWLRFLRKSEEKGPVYIAHLVNLVVPLLDYHFEKSLVYVRLSEAVLEGMEGNGSADVFSAGLQAVAHLQRDMDLGGKYWERFIDCVEKVVDGGNSETRLTCAGMLPCLTEKVGIGLVGRYWIMVLKLLRDDVMKIRTTMANQLTTFGLTPHPCIPNHAVQLVIDHLVDCSVEKNQLPIMIAMLTSEYINDDDRIVQSVDTDTTIFENCDRHEYHENLRVFRLLHQSVVRVSQNIMFIPSDAKESGVLKWMDAVRLEIDDCLKYLREGSFLTDFIVYNRLVFRLYCSLLVKDCLQRSGVVFDGWPDLPNSDREVFASDLLLSHISDWK